MAWEQVGKEEQVKVLVAILHSGTVSSAWAFNFAKFFCALQKHPFWIAWFRGLPIDVRRNQAVELMFEKNAEYLLFLDSDLTIPWDALDQLMERKLPIVSGLYWKRAHPLFPCMWQHAKDPKPEEQFSPILQSHCDSCGLSFITDTGGETHAKETGHQVRRIWTKGDLVEADVIGMGCCLIAREVFEKTREKLGVEKLFFEHTQYKSEWGVGEDFDFCLKAKKCGYKIYVDTGVVCKHDFTAVVVDGGIGIPEL